MDRDSPIYVRVHKKIEDYFKNNVPQHQIAKFLQITSSTDSKKLETSLCVRDKAEDLYWMHVIFRSSDDTASLMGMIVLMTSLNGPNVFPDLVQTWCTWSRGVVVSCEPRLI